MNPHDNIKIDKMRFQYNKLGQLLIIFGLAFATIGMFMLITYDNFGSGGETRRVVPDFVIALDIVFGIINLLVLFLAGEKVKYYDKWFSLYGVFIMAALNLIRTFLTPVYALNKGWLTQGRFTLIVVMMIIGTLFLIASGIISARKYLLLSKHKKEIEQWKSN